MKRAQLSRPKSTDGGGGILKDVRQSSAENKFPNVFIKNMHIHEP